MEYTSSQNWFWPECSCSSIRATQFSRSGRPKRGNLESYGGKNVRARFGPLHLNWSETVLLGRSEWTNGKRPKTRTWLLVSEILRLGLGCGGRTGVGLAGGVGAGLFFLRLPVLPSCARGLVSTASTSLSSVCCKSKKHHQQLTVLSKEASACWILTSYSYCCCHGVSLH